jgi:hypothetical protein
MIARVFAAAHLTVDAGGSETLRQWRTERHRQDIDGDADLGRPTPILP